MQGLHGKCSIIGMIGLIGAIAFLIFVNFYFVIGIGDKYQQISKPTYFKVTCSEDISKNLPAKTFENVSTQYGIKHVLKTNDGKTIIIPEDYVKEHCIYEEVEGK